MRKIRLWILIGSCAIVGIPTTALSGGLSADVAHNAMCDDAFVQCMNKVKSEIPCKGVPEATCREERYGEVKQCDFLLSHCANGPPVKRIKPVFDDKKKD